MDSNIVDLNDVNIEDIVFFFRMLPSWNKCFRIHCKEKRQMLNEIVCASESLFKLMAI